MARKNFKITQRRSLIGNPQTVRVRMRSLGLRGIGHSVVRADTPSTRGMIKKLSHLLSWTFTDEPEGSLGAVRGEKELADFDIVAVAEPIPVSTPATTTDPKAETVTRKKVSGTTKRAKPAQKKASKGSRTQSPTRKTARKASKKRGAP